MYLILSSGTLILLLHVTCCSSLDGSGWDNQPQEDNDHDNCIPVQGSHFNESLTTTTSYSKAHVLAMCSWGCARYYGTSIEINTSFTDVIMLSCANGCFNRFDNDTSLTLNLPTCVDICDMENECDEVDKITKNIECQSCLIGCEDIYEDLNLDGTLFTNDSHALHMYASDTLPEIHVLHNHSVNPMTVIVFLLHNVETNRNYYIIKQLNQGENIIQVDYLACMEVLLSYAYVNEYGIQRFSHERQLIISGVTQVEPAMLIVDESSYTNDTRPSYFGHYRMQLTLSYPSNLRSVQYFIIILRGIEIQQNECKPENFTASIDTIDQHSQFDDGAAGNDTVLVYNITATHPHGPPLSDCIYSVQILTVPKYVQQLPSVTSDIDYVKVPPYIPPKGVMYCTREYRADSGSFSMLIDVVLDKYVSNERVVESVDIIPKLVTYSQDLDKIMNTNAYAIIKKYIQYSVNGTGTSIKYSLDQYEPKASAAMIYQFSVYIYWRADLLYIPPVQSYVCNISGLSPQPDTIHFITNSSLSATRQSPTGVTTNQRIQWSMPVMNGQFDKYQICLTDTELHSTQDPSIPHLQCHELLLINQTSLPSLSTWHVFNGVDCLYVQIRSYNTYVVSNWSQPLIVSVDNRCNRQKTSSTTSIPYTTTSIVDSISSSSSSRSVSIPQFTVISNSTRESQDTTGVIDISVVGSATAAGIVLMCICISVTIILAVIVFHWTMRRRKRRLEYIEETHDVMFQMGPRIQVSLAVMEYDEWEVSPSQIIIDSALGQGAFGEVYRGVIEELPNNAARSGKKKFYNDFVAIKLLKTTASGEEKGDFLKEIDIMKQISTGNSPHVVNMIGCITSQEPLALITEFIKHGDLLTYLRINRKSLGIKTEEKSVYDDLNDLNATDLVTFGYQIAAGMEYLVSIGIVHRDLACRNVLIGEGKSLKITDFGMSRVIGDHEDDAYIKTTKGRLPLKWMAIESIVDREFTAMSDVWSYGVTLWEIATLGGFPYPTVANDKLLHQLKNGYRMERPSNCSKEVYSIMLDCWAGNPRARPKFTTLRKLFDKMLTAQNADSYIDLQTDETDNIYDITVTYDSSAASDESSGGDCIRMTLSPVYRGAGSNTSSVNGQGSKCSIDNTTSKDWLKVVNPWERSSSAHNISPADDTFSQLQLNRASSNGSTPLPVEGVGRPMSAAMIWGSNHASPVHTQGTRTENLYVDQPGAVSTAPSTPQKRQ